MLCLGSHNASTSIIQLAKSTTRRDTWILSQLACFGCAELKGVLAKQLYNIGEALVERPSKFKEFVEELLSCCRMFDAPWTMLLRQMLHPHTRSSNIEEVLRNLKQLCDASHNPAQDYPIFVPVIRYYLLLGLKDPPQAWGLELYVHHLWSLCTGMPTLQVQVQVLWWKLAGGLSRL